MPDKNKKGNENHNEDDDFRKFMERLHSLSEDPNFGKLPTIDSSIGSGIYNTEFADDYDDEMDDAFDDEECDHRYECDASIDEMVNAIKETLNCIQCRFSSIEQKEEQLQDYAENLEEKVDLSDEMIDALFIYTAKNST